MNKFIDLTSQRFGRLLVIKRVEKPNNLKGKAAYWLCKCDCGKEKIVMGHCLRNGDTQSCGCYNREQTSKKHLIDLTGKRFERLLVIKRVPAPENVKDRESVFWLCKCDCENTKIIRGDCLVDGNTKSCGCYNREKAKERFSKPLGEAAQNIKYSNYYCKAKNRNIIFELSKEEFLEITKQKCFYCGSELSNLQKSFNNHGDFIYNGIDRIDNNKGYTIKNVVPCCYICNRAKNTMTVEDFYEWVKRIYEYSVQNHEKGE